MCKLEQEPQRPFSARAIFSVSLYLHHLVFIFLNQAFSIYMRNTEIYFYIKNNGEGNKWPVHIKLESQYFHIILRYFEKINQTGRYTFIKIFKWYRGKYNKKKYPSITEHQSQSPEAKIVNNFLCFYPEIIYAW